MRKPDHEMPLEETLDPDDWDALIKLGQQMVADMLNHMASLDERPCWSAVPDKVKADISSPLPKQAQGESRVYAEFKKNVLPYSNGNAHPRFWGWVQGTGTAYGMLADMLASGMNPHLGGFEHAPIEVEKAVLNWLKQLMGFPEEATGLLTSGATMANLNALNVARHEKASFDFRRNGHQGEHSGTFVAYASAETHGWAASAMELLGLGSKHLRLIPVQEDYTIDCKLLRQSINSDLQQGNFPFCLIANIGTVNTGAIDDLVQLRNIADEFDLWLHADGAFGALVSISERYSQLANGIELMDSLAFDLHKWMYLPFEVGCILVRDQEAQSKTFASEASYLTPVGRGVAAGPLVFANLGIELTRGFKALKVWMSLKAHGVDKFSKLIAQNIEQAHYLENLVNESPVLELAAPVSLNVVCFRYQPEKDTSSSNPCLDILNQEILIRLQECGESVLSGTILKERFVLRAAIVNHRSRREHFKQLVARVEEIGKDCLKLDWSNSRSSCSGS